MNDRQDVAAQLLHQLAVNTRLKNAVKQCIFMTERYGGGDGDVLLKSMKVILEQVLYET